MNERNVFPEGRRLKVQCLFFIKPNSSFPIFQYKPPHYCFFCFCFVVGAYQSYKINKLKLFMFYYPIPLINSFVIWKAMLFKRAIKWNKYNNRYCKNTNKICWISNTIDVHTQWNVNVLNLNDDNIR